MTRKKIYRGMLGLASNGEIDDVLILSDSETFLAERVMDDMGESRWLTVRYFIADKELSHDDLLRGLIQTLSGHAEAEYGVRYSEITGYLWTDEKLKVGGHNLIWELKESVGKFCHLEIDFHESDKP